MRSDVDEGYAATGERMFELAAQQPGFLGVESFREESGMGVTISYWDSLDNIKAWKSVEAHTAAQKKGMEVWYKNYKTRICKVERDYEFTSQA